MDYYFASKATSRGQIVLRNSIERTLASLGENIRTALLWHLQNEGFSFSNALIDIDHLYESLDKIIGTSAEVIMGMVFQNICRQCTVKDEWFTAEMSTVEKIDAVLTMLNEEVPN